MKKRYPWGNEAPGDRRKRLETLLARPDPVRVSVRLTREMAEKQLEEVRQHLASHSYVPRNSYVSKDRVLTVPTTIYGLCDPDSKEVFYIGKTVQALKRRIAQHFTVALRNGGTAVQRWINSLDRLGKRPEVIHIATVPAGADWVVAEQYWIAHFRFLGAALKNATDGGQGCIGLKHSQATRARLSEATKRFMRTSEQRQRSSQRIWCRKLTDKQALEIVREYVRTKGMVDQKKLSITYGVAQSAISNLVRGHTFRDVIPRDLQTQASEISRSRKCKISGDQANEILCRYVKGCGLISIKQVGAEYGLRQRSVSDIICGKTHANKTSPHYRALAKIVSQTMARQKPHPNRPLTSEQVLWIRHHYHHHTKSLNEMAKILLISKKAVFNVAKGRTYTDVNNHE